MSQRGPHISIPAEKLLPRTLGLTPADVSAWPEDARALALDLGAELFLVRYNPYVDPEMVRSSVAERFAKSKPSLAGEFAQVLSARVAAFWKVVDADLAFRREVIARLKAILSPESVILSPSALVVTATDATDLRAELPLLVTAPANAAEVQAIVKLANEMGFGLIPRGGGTGLTGGAVPTARRCVIVSLSRLKAISRIDAEEMILCAEAGVLTLHAIKAVEEKGLLFTVDPASKAGSSLGGNLAENAGGPYAFEYGTTLDNLLSYRLVTPTGEMLEVTRLNHPRHKILPNETAVFEVKNEKGAVLRTIELPGDQIRGPGLGKDVTNKVLGGLPIIQKEGVDGIVVDACFTLYDRPTYSRVLCLEFFGRSMRPAALVVTKVVALRDRIRERGDLVKISALEEFGSKYVQAIDYQKKSSTYEGEPISVLILQMDSNHADALDEAVSELQDILRETDNVDFFLARDEKEAEHFWEDRHKLSAISRRTSGFKINEDVVIPIERIPDFSDFLEDLNLHFLARAYRKALKKADEMTESPASGHIDDEFIREELAFTAKVLKGGVTAAELSDAELEVQTAFFFRDLRSRYPALADRLTALEQEMRAKRVIVANHMHAGDGNCHVNIPVNSNDREMLDNAHEAAEMVFKRVLEMQGGVSGEHGIGITKIAFLQDEKIAALKAYKAEVDPKNVLNPAKLVSRELDAETFTFSFNSLIRDLRNSALPGRERLTKFLTDVQTCNRCGKCKQVCPMYNPVRGVMHHPRNKIISLGALIEAVYYSLILTGEPDPKLLGELRRLVEHCTGCGKCTSVCPNKIDTPEVTLHMRAFLEDKGAGGHPIKNAVLNLLVPDPSKRLPMAAKAVSLANEAQRAAFNLLPASWRDRHLAGRDSILLQGPGPRTGFKNLAETLRLDKGTTFLPESAPVSTVLYFPGCGASLFHRSIGLASVWLMQSVGAAVVLPEKHMCCGYPLLVSGREADYLQNQKRGKDALADLLAKAEAIGLKVDAVITSCGTCRESLHRWQVGGKDIRRMDVFQFLADKLPPLPETEPEILYHASCHAEWSGLPPAKVAEKVQAALKTITGASYRLSPGCCGESGLGALTSPDIYNRIRQRKQEILTGNLADYPAHRPILVGCPSCKIGVRRTLLLMKAPHQVQHTVERLAFLKGGSGWKKIAKKALTRARAVAEKA